MATLAVVVLVLIFGHFGSSYLIRQKRQGSCQFPAGFEQRARNQLGLRDPTTIPTNNEAFQSCRVNRKSGFCRHARFCVTTEYVSSYEKFIDNACTINNQYLGVCCPRTFVSNCDTTSSPPDTSNPIIDPRQDNPATTDTAICGVNTGIRIINGTAANPKDWVWMVALLRRRETQYCGGVLISSQYVLTAAHCTDKYKSRPQAMKVRVGEYDFKSTTESEHQDYDVAEIKVHPSYDESTNNNDIALVKLSGRVPRGTNPICLPARNQDYADRTGRVAGWGELSVGGPSSKILQETFIQIWPKDDCVRAFRRNREITSKMLCAGPRNGETDTCQGDSGGPLMVENSQERWEVVGIVSWGAGCAIPTYPGVYTRVSEFVDWIRENIQN